MENNFGRLDIKGQISDIKLTEELIDKQIEIAEENKNRNTRLYKTLGAVLGIGVVIILV